MTRRLDDPPDVLGLTMRLWNVENYLRFTRLQDVDFDALRAELAAIQRERDALSKV